MFEKICERSIHPCLELGLTQPKKSLQLVSRGDAWKLFNFLSNSWE